MRIAPKQSNEKVLRAAHVSMQFSDRPLYMESDADRIFRRAKKEKYRHITGTEAGSNDLFNLLKKYATKYGYWIHKAPGQDCWVAVEKRSILDIMDTGFDQAVDGKGGKWTNKGAMWIQYEDKDFGVVGIIAAHYLTKGRPDSHLEEFEQNLEHNEAIARAVGNRARILGVGTNLVFYGGDQNISDRKSDTFLGLAPLTSLGDELEIYVNTGHGDIDVMASYNHDHRVRGKSFKAISDKTFQLYTDHFLVEGEWYVRVLNVLR